MQSHHLLPRPVSAEQQPHRPGIPETTGSLAQIITVVVGARTGQWWLVAIAAVLGLVTVAASFGPVSLRWWKNRANRKHDDLVAREAMPELKALVVAFARLLNHSTNENLKALLKDALSQTSVPLARANYGPEEHFSNGAHLVLRRLEHTNPDSQYFLKTLDEFQTIVSAFSTYCLGPVFFEMSQEVRSVITRPAANRINSFREKYNGFRDEYSRFTEKIEQRLSAKHLSFSVFTPRPDALSV